MNLKSTPIDPSDKPEKINIGEIEYQLEVADNSRDRKEGFVRYIQRIQQEKNHEMKKEKFSEMILGKNASPGKPTYGDYVFAHCNDDDESYWAIGFIQSENQDRLRRYFMVMDIKFTHVQKITMSDVQRILEGRSPQFKWYDNDINTWLISQKIPPDSFVKTLN